MKTLWAPASEGDVGRDRERGKRGMYSYLLQDWTTFRIDNGETSLIQSEADWMSFQPYQDIIFWLDLRGLTLGGASDITLAYETSPSKDASLFLPMVSAVSLAQQVSATPIVTKVLLSQNPDVPLARWVRWKLAVTGSPTGDWGVTFRIHCSANAVGVL